MSSRARAASLRGFLLASLIAVPAGCGPPSGAPARFGETQLAGQAAPSVPAGALIDLQARVERQRKTVQDIAARLDEANQAANARDPVLSENQLREQLAAQAAYLDELERAHARAGRQWQQENHQSLLRQQTEAVQRDITAAQLKQEVAATETRLQGARARVSEIAARGLDSAETDTLQQQITDDSSRLGALQSQLAAVEIDSRVASSESGARASWEQSEVLASSRQAYERDRQTAEARYGELQRQLDGLRKQQAGQADLAGTLDQQFRVERDRLQELEDEYARLRQQAGQAFVAQPPDERSR